MKRKLICISAVIMALAMLVTLVRGLIHGESAHAVLWASWLSLLAFSATGYLVGWIAGRIVDEAVNRRITVELADRDSPPATTASPS